ncbi:uncharacterized protein LOC121641691 [Melanotaenia boesemani]|uniref:uncharacterized protein LOC121641691 n=1 Tax=Melanotaenia boesemani TaxID=1250792 RepID=UPI001C05C86C|nr:uncharacterized protein LOC121641691 [Melanotaenia boesemani]
MRQSYKKKINRKLTNLERWFRHPPKNKKKIRRMKDRMQTLHPTIVIGGKPPVICENEKYQCAVCQKHGEYANIFAHVQTHERAAVHHGGYKIFRCLRGCVKTPHHHCLYCGRTVTTQDFFIRHLNTCSNVVTLASSVPAVIVSAASSATHATSDHGASSATHAASASPFSDATRATHATSAASSAPDAAWASAASSATPATSASAASSATHTTSASAASTFSPLVYLIVKS